MADISEIRTQIVEVYIASFDRAPDYDGLEYWVGKMNKDGWNLDEVAASLFQSQEVAALYPASLSNSDFINKIYNNVLGRDADDAGLAYWLTAMQNGTPKDEMIIAVINGAKADTGNAQDKILLQNKEDAGNHFAVDLNLNDLSLAKSSMALITTDTLSVTLAKDKQDAFADSLNSAVTLLQGTDADDLLTSDAQVAHVYAWAGDDIVTTAAGDDKIVAGKGDDTVYSNAGNDTVYGREDDDTIYAGDGDDTLNGGEGNDSLHGEAGNDTIYGNNGQDYIYGDDGNDFLVGNSGNDFIYGGIGDDNIYANDGNDNIYAGDGANFVDAGIGDDILYGGSGIDSLYGGDGDDIIYGYDGNDILDGLIGNDTIHAGAGDDIINGNEGNDILIADSGSDRIDGEKGADTLRGGLGSDTLRGGEDADTFIFASHESNLSNLDTITDFEYQTDKITMVDKGTEVITTAALDVSSATTLSEAVNLSMTDDGSTNALVKWFTYEDNTYIIEDLNADATLNETTDIVVKLQGVLDLTTTTFIFI